MSDVRRARRAWGGAALLALAIVALLAPAQARAEPGPPVGSPAWQRALIEGASTSVPLSASPGYVDVDGHPFSVQTHITGVEFHVPGVASGAPGGMSPIPHPVRRVANGVEYWQVSGELSAVVVDYAGWAYVVGPIDSDGVDHRFDTGGSHPRAGLPGAHFVLRYPVKGYNGRLITHQAPNDGGFFFPAAPLTDLPVDPLTLLDRGYALFTAALGGTVFEGESGGRTVVDTNPDSGTGIFWGGDLVSYLRPARIGPHGEETAYPEPSNRTLWVPGEGEITLDLGDPSFGLDNGVTLQEMPELVRDGVVVGKRLVRELTGSKREPWTAFLGWSGSGRTAAVLSMGRVTGVLPMAPGVQPYTGGNFNRFHDPSSGKRFDAFLVMAPGRPVFSFVGDGEYRPSGVDDRYPVGAPMVFIGGDADHFGLSLSGVVYANLVARALPGSALAGTPIGDLVATYTVHGLGHVTNDFAFMNDVGRGPADGLRYARNGAYPNPDGFNRDGRGHLIQPVWSEFGGFVPSVLQDDFLWNFYADVPRTTPLFLQSLDNLEALTTRGKPLPTSRIETKLFTRLDTLVPADTYPLLPQPCPALDFGQDPPPDPPTAMIDCAATIEQDSQLGFAFPDGFGAPSELGSLLDEARYFAVSNPLPRVVGSLEVPDIAAALGPRLHTFGFVVERRLSDAQLRAGFTAADGRVYRFKNHGDYVKAFRKATDALVKQGLWERRLGEQYVDEAERSDVLR